MTENEVFEHISNLAGDYKCFDEKISHQESLMLCNLIEEIQQYRAIGTVEQLEWCKDASHWKELFKEKLEKYEAIGTVEDIQEVMALCKSLQETTCKYMDIGTVEELQKAKEQYDDIHSIAEKTALIGLSDYGTAKEAVITEMKRNLDYSLKEYQSIGTIDEFKALKEKDTPYKPQEYEDRYYACKCDNILLPKWRKYPTELMPKSEGLPHCMACGQKLDWQ